MQEYLSTIVSLLNAKIALNGCILLERMPDPSTFNNYWNSLRGTTTNQTIINMQFPTQHTGSIVSQSSSQWQTFLWISGTYNVRPYDTVNDTVVYASSHFKTNFFAKSLPWHSSESDSDRYWTRQGFQPILRLCIALFAVAKGWLAVARYRMICLVLENIGKEENEVFQTKASFAMY